MSWNIPGAQSTATRNRSPSPGFGPSVPPPPQASSSTSTRRSSRADGSSSSNDGAINQLGSPPGGMMMGGGGGGAAAGGGTFFIQRGMAPETGGRYHWPFGAVPPNINRGDPGGSAGGGVSHVMADDSTLMDWGGPTSGASATYMMQQPKMEAPGTPIMQGMDGGYSGSGQQQQEEQSAGGGRMVPPPPSSSMEGMRAMPVFMLGSQANPMTGVPPPPRPGGGAGGAQRQSQQQQQQGNPTYAIPTHIMPTQFMAMPQSQNSMPPPQQGVFNPPPSAYMQQQSQQQQQQQQQQMSTQPIASRPHTYQPPPILPRSDGSSMMLSKAHPMKDEEDTSSQAQDEAMTDERKKRLRNEREQKRAHLITDQIETLKQVLEQSNFPLRSTSKYDVLAGCDEYIQHLRQRKYCLDMELKLGSPPAGPDSSQQQMTEDASETKAVVLDFCEIFRSSHVPMAVVSIDGRILQCNDEFSRVTGYTNDKLAGVTLFSLAAPECLEELFKSIARLLSTAQLDEKNPAYFATAAARAAPLALPGYENSNILLSLVRDAERRAKAFHCCIVPQRMPRSSVSSAGQSMS